MFHDRKIDNKINKIQERAFRIAYKDNTSRFKEFLEKDNSVSIHKKNLQLLMIEIYKTENQLNPLFMIEIFKEKAVPYQLRSQARRQLNWIGGGGGMNSQYKLLSELLSDQAAFITSPKTSLANYWGALPPLPPSVYGPVRSTSNLNLPKVTTTYYGTDTVRFIGQRARAKLPTEIKTSSFLAVFKKQLKSKKCWHCNYRICN